MRGHKNQERPIESTIAAIFKRDRLVVLGALILVIVLCWVYIFTGAGMHMSAVQMTRMGSDQAGMLMMMTPAVWDFGYAVLMFFMWWVMMIAMMLPSATPMVLLFDAFNHRQKEKGNPFVPTSIFVSAYLVVWAGFSIVAVATQWALERAALLNPMLESANSVFGGALLVTAGVYQFSPLKQACLKHCRSPLQFIMTRWREGTSGALRMGVEHGTYCVGCCWFLMALLYFGGVMNLYWIIGLALLVLMEKTIPHGHWVSRACGAGLIIWGIAAVVTG